MGVFHIWCLRPFLPGFSGSLGIFQLVAAIDIDYLGIFICSRSRTVDTVQMNMAVQQIFGLKHPHKPEKNLKPLVARVILVVDAPWCRMSEQNIEVAPVYNAVPQQTRQKPNDFEKHLELAKLVRPSVIAATTAKTGDNQAIFFQMHHTVPDIGSASGRQLETIIKQLL